MISTIYFYHLYNLFDNIYHYNLSKMRFQASLLLMIFYLFYGEVELAYI